MTEDSSLSATRAQGRWKLLREALLGKDNNGASNSQHSIHRFSGYNLLSSQTLSEADAVDVHEALLRPWKEQDSTVPVNSSQRFFLSISALLSLNRGTIEVFCTREDIVFLQDALPEIEVTQKAGDEETFAKDSSRSRLSFQINGSHVSYCIRRYTSSDLDNPLPQPVLCHERLTSAKKTLKELTSHHHHNEIDNTGNIRVWDCESVLTWFLHSSEQANNKLVGSTVLELGAGMAGIAGLSLNGIADTVYLTDGHPDCVRNNQINVQLLEASNSKCRSTFQCQLLKWSYDDSSSPIQADWTLVSDCSHFEEYHGELLWTCMRHTRVGGNVWMCQPQRGQSLDRFIAVARQFCTVTKISHETIDQMHGEYVKNNSCYSPNIHRPLLVSLTKTRDLDSMDKQAIKEYIETRRKPNSTT